jgi:L-rhamnose mutarotase
MVSKEGRVLGRTIEFLHRRRTNYLVKYVSLNGYRTEEFFKQNKKFWEELIAYFRSLQFDYSIHVEKQTLVCMRNEINKRMVTKGARCLGV